MHSEVAEGLAGREPSSATAPQFDLFIRRLGDVDSPETMAWWADPDWRGGIALAAITPRGSARIVSACVVLGEGRHGVPVAGPKDAGERNATRRREVERRRSVSRTAIGRVLAEPALRRHMARFHVTSAFAFRTVKGLLGDEAGVKSGVVLARQGAACDGNPAVAAGTGGAGPRGATAFDSLAADLATWLERRYFHDDWVPADTGQAALSSALETMVAAHNGELDEPPWSGKFQHPGRSRTSQGEPVVRART